ncbi:MAG: glycosyltransferase [Candidatus Desulforudis sp.]|nr:glycosyltransferase [Desulforudis sp.]
MEESVDNLFAMLPKPIVGYIGAIRDWIDWRLVAFSATKYPNMSFVFVGSGRAPSKMPPNVHFLGRVDYGCIPSVLRKFDIGIIPFKVDSCTLSVDPVKLYEYCAVGIPVVSTYLPDGCPEGCVYVAQHATGFADMVLRALEDPHDVPRKLFAQSNSWAVRVKLIEDILACM